MGTVADKMFSIPVDQLTAATAWTGALCYTLQIFFDFSGYSDMAIGLGRMLGFRFPENFDQPYRSRSITEFWRRWHMTLSHWFRDYLYIPLGGNRCGSVRPYSNLMLVFVLCGLWHGAAYTFLLWGCYHGALLIIERIGRAWITVPTIIQWPATVLLITIGCVFFRSPTISEAKSFLLAMAGMGGTSSLDCSYDVTADKITFFVLGIVFSLVRTRQIKIALPIKQAFAGSVFSYSAMLIAANGFNPFIYFRF